MTDEESTSVEHHWSENKKEDRRQRGMVLTLLKRGHLKEGQTVVFNYKRNSFDCTVKADGELLYNDEDYGTKHVFVSINAFANWCTLHKCDNTNRTRTRTVTDGQDYGFAHFYADGRRLSDIINGLSPESPPDTVSEENYTANTGKRKGADRRDRNAERSSKSRSERNRSEDKRDERLDEEDDQIYTGGSRRRNTRLASGSIKQVDYKISASGSLNKAYGESDEDSGERGTGTHGSAAGAVSATGNNSGTGSAESGAVAAGDDAAEGKGSKENSVNQTRGDSDKEAENSDTGQETADKNNRRSRTSRARKNTKEEQEEDKQGSQSDNEEQDGENVAAEGGESDNDKEEDSHMQDAAALMYLDGDAGDSEEHSDGVVSKENAELELKVDRKALLEAIKSRDSLEPSSLLQHIGGDAVEEDIEKLLEDLKLRMASVDLIAEGDANASVQEAIAFLAAEILSDSKASQDGSLKRSRSELEMDRHVNKLISTLESSKKAREEIDRAKGEKKRQLEELRERIDFEAKTKKQLEKEKTVVEDELKLVRESVSSKSTECEELDSANINFKLKELEARRRLDRTNLKVVALQGDIRADTVDKLVDLKRQTSNIYGSLFSNDEQGDLPTLLARRRKLEQTVNKMELESIKWLRCLESQKRSSSQLMEAKNRLEAELYIQNPKLGTKQHASRVAPASKVDKKGKPSGGKDDAQKKDKTGAKGNANAEQAKEDYKKRKLSGNATNTQALSAGQQTAAGVEESKPEFVETKRKTKPLHSMA